MTDTNHEKWLTSYYNRIQSECELSIGRRDKITRLCYIVIAAGIAIYVSFFADGSSVPPLGRFALVSGILIVLIRFFFQSMIAYGYFIRGRYLREQIEQYWMWGSPSIDEVKKVITRYDHCKAIPKTKRSLLMGQINFGFGLMFVVAAILLTIELSLEQSWNHCLVLIGLAGYVSWETFTFKRYDQMRVGAQF